MLTIVPRHWWSWDFDVMDGTRLLARVDTSAWREKGVLTIDGVEHRVYRDGVMSGDFVLERDGMPLVKACKPSAFKKVLIVSYNGREYTLRKKSAWRTAFVLLEADREIGSLTPNGLWRRDARVTLTHDWPLHPGVRDLAGNHHVEARRRRRRGVNGPRDRISFALVDDHRPWGASSLLQPVQTISRHARPRCLD